MTMSKVKNFLTGADRRDSSHDEPANFGPGSGNGAISSEQFIDQLREIILAPSAQMAERRFIEMLNVIEDHKAAAERRLDKVDRHLTDSADKATIMAFNIEGHDEDIRVLRQQVGDELQAMRAEQTNLLTEIRQSLDHGSRQFFADMTKRAEDFETAIRNEVYNLSNSLMGHVAQEDRRWEEERQNSAEMMEQLITQWRSERENVRRQDMESLAGSMMDIGRRLMSAQPHA
jgi:hypothetical protein